VNGVQLPHVLIIHQSKYLSIELLDGLMILGNLNRVVSLDYRYLFALFYLAIIEWRSLRDCNIELPDLVSFIGSSLEVVVCYW
jgi:hypothetical protein